MLISRAPKAKGLNLIVERVWSAVTPDAAGHETLLPSGKAQIIFSLSDTPFAVQGSDAKTTGKFAHQIFQGPTSRPRRMPKRSHIALCGVAFTAGGAGTIHDRIDETSDRVVDLCDLWGDAAHDLCDRLCRAKDEHSRLDLLEADVAARVSDTSVIACIQTGMELLRRGHRINDVCDRLGCSPYIFRKQFVRHVGFTPKHYLRIERFRAAVAQLGPDASLADVAADGSFADQAHMTRETDHFGNMTPGRMKSIVRPYPGHVPED